MSDINNTVIIRVLDKEYQVACPLEEREGLMKAADNLDQRMREIRKTGNVIGLERIAVMVALNLAHELQETKALASNAKTASKDLSRLDKKLTQALSDLA